MIFASSPSSGYRFAQQCRKREAGFRPMRKPARCEYTHASISQARRFRDDALSTQTEITMRMVRWIIDEHEVRPGTRPRHGQRPIVDITEDIRVDYQKRGRPQQGQCIGYAPARVELAWPFGAINDPEPIAAAVPQGAANLLTPVSDINHDVAQAGSRKRTQMMADQRLPTNIEQWLRLPVGQGSQALPPARGQNHNPHAVFFMAC